MKVIRYKAPIFDQSGLGTASNQIFSLLKRNEKNYILDVQPISLIDKKYENRNDRFEKYKKYDICFIFSTPYDFKRHIESDKINIGYCMWETDRHHESFVESVKDLDLLIVPCKENKKVFDKIHNNVIVVPLPLSESNYSIKPKLERQKTSNFTFYSIYDWTERKGGIDSLRAYFEEFDGNKEVNFVIKTKGNFINEIPLEIKELKEEMASSGKVSFFPKVEIRTQLYNDIEIRLLHYDYNCYVSLSRGEGWNLGLFDAALNGNYCISTHPSGVTEYLKGSYSFYPIKSTKKKVIGMEWFSYMDSTHKWYYPDIKDARKQMRAVYDKYSKDPDKELKKLNGDNKKHLLDFFDAENIYNKFLKKELENYIV